MHNHNWTYAVSPPHLCGALPGCRVSHLLPAAERIGWCQDEKPHHWMCLADLPCRYVPNVLVTSSIWNHVFRVPVFHICGFLLLFRSGPGEGGRKGVLTDQSKLKAFQTMVIITWSLSMRFISTLIAFILKSISVPNGYIFCVAGWASVWLCAQQCGVTSSISAKGGKTKTLLTKTSKETQMWQTFSGFYYLNYLMWDCQPRIWHSCIQTLLLAIYSLQFFGNHLSKSVFYIN